MRQLKGYARLEEKKSLDLTAFGLQDAAAFLNHPKGLHIETLYFTNDGKYWLNCFEWEGKFYSRLDLLETTVTLHTGVEQKILKRIGIEKNLIVKALDADEIVDLVEEWKEKYATQIIETDPNDKRNIPEEQKRKITRWINNESTAEYAKELNSKISEKVLTKASKKELINGKK